MFLCHFTEANYLSDGCFGSQNPLCLALASHSVNRCFAFMLNLHLITFKVHPFYSNFHFTFYNTFEK